MEMTCIKCNYVLKHGNAGYYCCNQKEIYCMLCYRTECKKCKFQRKKIIKIIKLQVPCKLCKTKFPNEEINPRFEICVRCINSTFERKKIHFQFNYLHAKEKQLYLQFLQRFCCLCLKSLSKKYICLEDGRRIDSICYQCNQTELIIKIKTNAQTCEKCQFILGDSLYMQTKTPSLYNKKICSECEQSQQQKKEVRSPIQQKKALDPKQQKNNQIIRCMQCKKQKHSISEETNLCETCSSLISYYQRNKIYLKNKQQQKRTTLLTEDITLDHKQKISYNQPYRHKFKEPQERIMKKPSLKNSKAEQTQSTHNLYLAEQEQKKRQPSKRGQMQGLGYRNMSCNKDMRRAGQKINNYNYLNRISTGQQNILSGHFKNDIIFLKPFLSKKTFRNK